MAGTIFNVSIRTLVLKGIVIEILSVPIIVCCHGLHDSSVCIMLKRPLKWFQTKLKEMKIVVVVEDIRKLIGKIKIMTYLLSAAMQAENRQHTHF